MSGFSVLRADRGILSPPVTATIYEGRVARTHAPGDALVYKTGPEHRDGNELQNIVNQLTGLPVYLGHPTVFPSKDSGQKIVGTVESGRLDEDTAVGRLSITDEEALAAIRAGTHELSLGYACGLDAERYQRGIQLDHLAIVEIARCGAQCSLRVDMLMEEPVKVAELEVPITVVIPEETKQALASIQATLDAMSALGKTKCESCGVSYDKGATHECAKSDQVEPPVKSCTCNNRTINHNIGETMSQELNQDTAAELAALKTQVEKLEIEATNARKDAEAAQAALTAAKAEVEAAKTAAAEEVAKAKTDAADSIKKELDARVASRVTLLTEAARFELKDAEGAKLDLSKLSDRDVKVAVIKHVDGDDVPAEKSDDFVDGVYRGSLKRGQDAAGSRANARVTINQMRNDAQTQTAKPSGRAAEAAAKEAMKRESALAWTKTNTENA